MIVHLLVTQLLFVSIKYSYVSSQSPSPCPDVFSYEQKDVDEDRWYGTISLKTLEDLTGVWITIQLDKPAEILGNWFGDTVSNDNEEFRISNPNYKLEAGPPISVRFFVKYDRFNGIPSVQGIRLNGKVICSAERDDSELRPTTPKLHISRPGTTKRPVTSSSSVNNRPIYTSGSKPGRRPVDRETGDIPSNVKVSNKPNTSNLITGDVYDPPSYRQPDENSQGLASNRDNRLDTRPSTSNYNTGTYSDKGSTSYDELYENNQGHFSGSLSRPSTSNANNRITSGGNSNGNTLSVSDNEDDDFFPGDFANIKRPAQNKPASRPHTLSVTTESGCGIVAARPSPLITNGHDTTPGQWPWHAALYHSKGFQLLYICGGTLISHQHVVTAAHCVTKLRSNKILNVESVLVYLGKYDLVTFGPEVQDRSVSDIFIHPEYNHSVYFNDIAVLKLSRPVETTNFVRPCCLWAEDTSLDSVISRPGTVIGWGYDESKKLSNKLMQAQMPVVSTSTCIFSNREFFSQFTFEKNYCAGFRNGTSVCNGDSGGGMVFPKTGTRGQNTVWQLRGVISVSVALQGHGVCDTSQYILFTDVAKHLSWIKQTMSY
ncbi:uncharacterized protein isoform X1 [Leptinotarsa decemlineata]|uniref:uncharacterized protein isoform X1 n=1 Tax=Leptinotarsa decemlineata TaxID=7539 RepID=UPI003D30D461